MPTTSEVSTRLSADNSNFRTVFRQSEDVAEKTGKAILKKIDLRAGVGAIAAAIGFNMQGIAEGIARLVTGFSADAEQALGDLVAATGKAADAQERLLERARARKAKEAEDKRKLYEDEDQLINNFQRKEEEFRRKKAADAAKQSEENDFAEDLRWVKEQDRIAAKKKLELARIEEVKAAELAANEEAARVEQARIDEKFKSLIDQWKGFVGMVTTTGRGDRELSDRELQRKIANIRQALFESEINRVGRVGVGNERGEDPFSFINQANLSGAQSELNLRRQVRQRAAAFGEERAFQQFPGLTEQRFSEIIKGIDTSSTGKLVAALDKLNQRLDAPLLATLKPTPFST